MPGTLDRYSGFPAIAASTLKPGEVVRLASGVTERGVCPILATSNEFAFGVIDTRVGTTLPGEAVTVQEQGSVVEGIAAASLGAGAVVAMTPSQGFAPIAGASGSLRYAVGDALTPAAPGEYFSLYIRPRALSGGA